MKYIFILHICSIGCVASFAEAWIEIGLSTSWGQLLLVASFAEAWIEILKDTRKDELFTSPPSRRRGLKSNISEETLVGTISRLLRGGVD